MSISPTVGLSPLAYLDAQAASTNLARSVAFEQILGGTYAHPMKAQAAISLSRAKNGAAEVVDALAANDLFRVEAPSETEAPSSLRAQLRMVARMILANEMLGMRRQIFFVDSQPVNKPVWRYVSQVDGSQRFATVRCVSRSS